MLFALTFEESLFPVWLPPFEPLLETCSPLGQRGMPPHSGICRVGEGESAGVIRVYYKLVHVHQLAWHGCIIPLYTSLIIWHTHIHTHTHTHTHIHTHTHTHAHTHTRTRTHTLATCTLQVLSDVWFIHVCNGEVWWEIVQLHAIHGIYLNLYVPFVQICS